MEDREMIQNRAQRLHDVLLRAKSGCKKSNNTWKPVCEAWATTFNVDSSDRKAIYRNLIELSNSIDWTERKINNSSIRRKDLYTRNLGRLRDAVMNSSMAHTANVIHDQLTDVALSDLLHAAERIGDTHEEGDLEESVLIGLEEDLERIIGNLQTSRIDERLQSSLIDILTAAREILSQYEIRGADALREAIESVYGRIARQYEDIKPHSKEDWAKDLMKWLSHADTAYDAVQKYGPLLSKGAQLLLE